MEDDRSINSPKKLAMEATYINRNFSQQTLKMVKSCGLVSFELQRICLYFKGEEKFNFESPNPFLDESIAPSEVPSVGYRLVWAERRLSNFK